MITKKCSKKITIVLFAMVLLFAFVGCGSDNGDENTIPAYLLTTATEGNGTVNPSEGIYQKDDTFELIAVPDTGWVFKEWKGDISSQENPYTVVMNSDLSVIASFEEASYDYDLTITTSGSGSVVQNQTSQNAVELTAYPQDGWYFEKWEGDIEGLSIIDNPLEVTLDKDITLNAVFSQNSSNNGTLKFINSWGTSYTENYITYDAAIDNFIPCFVFEPYDNYEPKVIALFEIEGDNRGIWEISFEANNTTKSFYNYYTYGNGGDLPFPDNVMVMDISDLMPFNDEDIIITLTNNSSTSGRLVSYSIEVYNDGYDQLPTNKYTCSSTADISSGETYTATISNVTAEGSSNSLNLLDLKSISRPITYEDIDRISGDYYSHDNEIINGHGTGLKPPSRDQLETALINDTMRIIESDMIVNTNLKASGFIDHSTSQYFPPIGDQMQEGSCAAWSAAYYILGFYQARERDWDYRGKTFASSDWDKLISPEFAYHLVNNGEDKGTNPQEIWLLAHLNGVSSLANMPYSDQDYNSWPGEEAWREAPKYRAGSKLYYFEIDDMDDINAIKTLLEAGYLISIAVDADQYDDDGIWSSGDYSTSVWEDLNHANTIVGYED